MRNKICSEINISIHPQEKREKKKKPAEFDCRSNWWLVCMSDTWSNLQKLQCFPCFCAPDPYSCSWFLLFFLGLCSGQSWVSVHYDFMTFVISLWLGSNLLCLYTVPCSRRTVHSKITFDSYKRIILWLTLLTREALSILIFLCIFSQLISWQRRLELNAYFSCG